MNKRGFEFEWSPMMYFLIGLVAFSLIVYFFFLSPSGLQAATKIGEKIGLSNLPEKQKIEIKESEKVPDEIKNSFNDLVSTIKSAKSYNKKNCLIVYNVPESIEDFNINVKDGGGALSLTVYNKLDQLKLNEKIDGLRACYFDKTNRIFNQLVIGKEKEEYYKLLYKDNLNNICFIKKCNDECLYSFNARFCEIKDNLKDVFYQKTYYGNIEDWKLDKLIGSFVYYGISLPHGEYYRWRYYGDNKRVPYVYTQYSLGIEKNEFEKIFDTLREDLWKKYDYEGVYYKEVYYGKKEDWSVKDGKWYYYGDEDVPDDKKKGINPEEKYVVLGGPAI